MGAVGNEVELRARLALRPNSSRSMMNRRRLTEETEQAERSRWGERKLGKVDEHDDQGLPSTARIAGFGSRWWLPPINLAVVLRPIPKCKPRSELDLMADVDGRSYIRASSATRQRPFLGRFSRETVPFLDRDSDSETPEEPESCSRKTLPQAFLARLYVTM